MCGTVPRGRARRSGCTGTRGRPARGKVWVWYTPPHSLEIYERPIVHEGRITWGTPCANFPACAGAQE
eukprot:scaffold20324_cov81-Isochrysis_galbana.AAC.3